MRVAMSSTGESDEPNLQDDGSGEQQPESYRCNSKKERLLLSYCDNFTIQFKKLYGDRKPLLLRPLNECGIEKFVCTTLRPTCLHFKELYDWDGCASFVADYITCSPLHPPDELPQQLHSPTWVLSRQEGSSFDMATVLCSLLVGVGYDAYCVSGYAEREVTEVDQTGSVCPLLEEKEKEEEEEVKKKLSRYVVRPPRELSSHFERRLEDKARAEEERKRREEEAANAPAAEEPEVDKYHGLRVHCWVLVLSGKREVAQNFFIEPTTGESHVTDSELYQGIESLWNHRNYWINMQDCAQGLKDVMFDLGDATKWEFFFPNVEQPLLVVNEDSSVTSREEKQVADDGKEDFELPPSWVLPIHISSKDFETHCPHGKRTTLYHKSRLETFSDYLNSDGLVTCLSLFSDTARRSKVETRSWYRYREDRLQCRVVETGSGQVHEEFGPGREKALKRHSYSTIHSHTRAMAFYHNARVDGLSSRELTASEMVEQFEARPDLLYQRTTSYTPSSLPRRGGDLPPQREITRIVERFHHNPAVPPNSDVAVRQFTLSSPTSIRVTYHLEPNRITASHRHFLTPPRSQEHNLTFDPQTISGYQADPNAAEPGSQELFQQLESLIAAQETAISLVRASEREVAAILGRREEEEADPQLMVSVYDVARNQKAFQQREEEEERAREEERLQREKERDYLAPFLGRLVGDCEELDREQMAAVTEECLRDKRQNLVEKANRLQAQFDSMTEELSRKQAWYKANQTSITRETEADYIADCNDALFKIHILEQRLNIHKTTAPEKYLQLERKLREDPRLQPH